jgi:homoserine O-acetyltransferase
VYRHPPLAPGWIDRPHLRFEMGNLQLESGEILRDAFISYVVHGDPALLRDRAILVATAIGSTHHRLDFLIGPNGAMNTDTHCIIVADALGNGLSSSPSNSVAQPASRFPRFTLRDMVETQKRLLDDLRVDRLVCVVGASMGGMQTLQWGVSHPGRMRAIVAITPMARTARWSQLVNELSRRALFQDEQCRVPRPRHEAMRLWVPLTQLVIARTPQAIEGFRSQAALMAWLDERVAHLQGDGLDPFDWCYQTWAYDAHDVGSTPGCAGDVASALNQIKAATLILAPSQDLYNPGFAAREASAAIAGSRFIELPGDDGHASASGVNVTSTLILRQAVQAWIESVKV